MKVSVVELFYCVILITRVQFVMEGILTLLVSRSTKLSCEEKSSTIKLKMILSNLKDILFSLAKKYHETITNQKSC